MTRRDAYLMVAIVSALAIATIAFGERVGVHGGTGWDGMRYARWAAELRLDDISPYEAQRILPSAIVHAGLRAAGATGRIPHAILGFQILDAIAIVGAAVAWAAIARLLAWSRAAAWAGFAGVFASFAIARHALYYPTLCDPTAFALGMAMIWAYLARRPIALAVVALAAAFTWPILPEVALGLLIMRRPAEPVPPLEARWVRPAAIAIGGGAAAIACAVALYFLAYPYYIDDKWAAIVPRAWLPFSVPCLAAWLAFAWYALAREPRIWNVRVYARSLADRRLAFAVAAAVVVIATRAAWVFAVSGMGGRPPEGVASELALEALRGPLWDLVHHVVYFGPIVIVAIGAWRRVAATAASWGPGITLALALTVALAIGSESRQWTPLFPLLAAATIAATAAWWTPRRAIAFAGLCLVWSKLWWRIGWNQATSPFDWPAQRYFMQQGPWASNATFVAHLAAAVLTAGVLVLFGRRQRAHDPR